jgi:hypothetical protein
MYSYSGSVIECLQRNLKANEDIHIFYVCLKNKVTKYSQLGWGEGVFFLILEKN